MTQKKWATRGQPQNKTNITIITTHLLTAISAVLAGMALGFVLQLMTGGWR